MNERDLDTMIREMQTTYRRYLRGAGAPNATITVLLEDLAEHLVESIRSELGLRQPLLGRNRCMENDEFEDDWTEGEMTTDRPGDLLLPETRCKFRTGISRSGLSWIEIILDDGTEINIGEIDELLEEDEG